jgi:hypothetical protein
MTPQEDSPQIEKPPKVYFGDLPTPCYVARLFQYSSTAKAIEAYRAGKRAIRGSPILCQILEMSFCTNLGEGFEEPIERNFPNLRLFTREEYEKFFRAEERINTTAGLCILLSKKEESTYQTIADVPDTASKVELRIVSYRLDLKPKKPRWTLFG